MGKSEFRVLFVIYIKLILQILDDLPLNLIQSLNYFLHEEHPQIVSNYLLKIFPNWIGIVSICLMQFHTNQQKRSEKQTQYKQLK